MGTDDLFGRVAPTVNDYEAHVRNWLASFVVGLDLCPFARPLLESDSLRISVCEEQDWEALQVAFLRELDLLQCSSDQEIATTLLVFPTALGSFPDFLDFLAQAQELLVSAGVDDLFQLASFHPQYEFEGAGEAAAGNFSNRSPYPVLHFLRENMMGRLLSGYPNPETIPERNIATLESMGSEELNERWLTTFQQ